MLSPQEVYDRTLAFEGQTTLHPLGVTSLVVLMSVVFLAKRRYAVLPFLVLAAFIPSAQRVVIASLDFNFLRLLVLAGWARMFAKGELRYFRWGKMDRMMLAWVAASVVTYTLLHGSVGALVNRAGRAYDVFGLYIFMRCMIRDWEDVDRIFRQAAWLVVPSFVLFFIEKTTGRNVFSIFGGVPEMTKVREGKLRAQGPFPHPILAGCFWVGFLPLIGVHWWRRSKSRFHVVIGIPLAIAIVFMCASSTPIGGLAATLGASMIWFVRRYVGLLRTGAFATLVMLHMVMNTPVWHLIARIDLTGGSTGWHRYLLIDNSVRHFSSWALLGIKSTDHWGPNMGDLANQYVAVAMRGGFLTLVLFVAMLTLAFQAIGRLLRKTRRSKYQHRVAFSFGVALTALCAMFLAISIQASPQNLTTFMILLASIRSLDQSLSSRRYPFPVSQPAATPRMRLVG